MKIQFYLRFHTSFGQTLWIIENKSETGTDILQNAIPLTYLNEDFWEATLKLDREKDSDFRYKYVLKNKDGEIIPEWGDDRILEITKSIKETVVIDTWNHAGEYENVFYTAPFQDILLKQKKSKATTEKKKSFTHIFKVKAPLLTKNECICLVGNGQHLGNWLVENPVLLAKENNWWVGYADLHKEEFPVAYKYGVYNIADKKFVRFENGDNRLVFADAAKKKVVILHDGFAHLPNTTWKGAGVTIPVFSLRSKKSLGIGEFSDIELLVDWVKNCGFKLIQLLPVNDTTATHSWKDSYPYAAISAFALHPVYINLEKVAGKKHAGVIKKHLAQRSQLNSLSEVDYESVIKYKLDALKDLYKIRGKNDLDSDAFQKFFDRNKHWLIPYAGFCFLRDKYKTLHFEDWKTNNEYNKKEIEKLTAPGSKSYPEIAFHYFVQYHLHLQLKAAADYAHKKGIILKGDIPIGIYRYGCDAWTAPALYNMSQQAGAPPDDFAIKGQNWGFPTYNWKKMQDDHFEWWRRRFEQMSHYFDAFRIDHILGFFRIWSIPMDAVEGIMGRFDPALPIHIRELGERGIWFDYRRYCKPYITDHVLHEIFGDLDTRVKTEFLVPNDYGTYDLELSLQSQKQVEGYFSHLETGEENEKLKQGLYDLISNVIFFEEEGSDGQKFHFRISMENTASFRHLDWHVQQKLKQLYVDYFYRRQDDFWKKEAMAKLPYLKKTTNMLICGEDLGMVPHCVPDVMKQLGILSLEIQRMPKAAEIHFFHPNQAPYLSVVTPSTHDMSTIRGWWEEDRGKTQVFFNQVLGQWGEAPVFCEPWINRAIVLQHLYSPGMWSTFLWQDLLGMSEKLRRDNPQEERINIPAITNHYWRYRMHITLEDLIEEKEFSHELKGYIEHAGR